MKLSELKTNPENPRLIRDENFFKLVKNIKEFPAMMKLRPIVVDENNMVLGGNMRVRALEELKYKDIPEEWVKKATELTEDEKKRFIILDNKPFGEWDYEMLGNLYDMADLIDWGFQDWEFNGGAKIENTEIDTNALNDNLVIKLEYSQSEYEIVMRQLKKHGKTPEAAVWKLLGNDPLI